jgi:hypothetical protein
MLSNTTVSQTLGGLKNNKRSETLKITYKTELSELNYQTKVGWDSSVGIATHYGQNSSGIESWWGLDLLHLSGPAWGTTQSLLYIWYWVSFVGENQMWHAINQPLQSSTKVKERV